MFTNYRPISLLIQFSKILEIAFDIWLEKCIELNEILNDSHNGFQKNRSPSLALSELTEEIANAIDQNKSSVGVFIDLNNFF